MIEGFAVLLLCHVLGTFTVDALRLPLPGPVLGMVFLLAWLAWRRPEDDSPTLRTADGLLRIMPVLFVPAGVGVVVWLREIGDQWLPLTAGLLLPWLAALVATGATAALVGLVGGPDSATSRRAGRHPRDARAPADTACRCGEPGTSPGTASDGEPA